MSALRPVRALTLAALIAGVTVLVIAAAPASIAAQGLLLPRDEGLAPLQLRHHDVEIEVTDNGAVTHVSQVFANNTSQDLEATFYFAVPPGSVTTDFALWMNGARVRGEVLPRERAREIYDGIVRRMRDPGLLEYVDGTLFQASIYPVPAMGEQRVEIEYASVLSRQGELLHYQYPIHESGVVPQFVVSGRVASSRPIVNLHAPYHEIEIEIGRGGHEARFSMEQSRARLDHDFELFITQSGHDVGFSMLTFGGDDGEDGYFMMTLAPSPELEDLEVLPKTVTFVVDTSGSMAGEKIEQARDMLRYCVDALDPRDYVQLIAFSSAVRPAFPEPVSASPSNLRDARAFIDAITARGNTNISGALQRALDDDASSSRPHTVIFVTDGIPTEGDTSVDGIVEAVRAGVHNRDRRVFAFGVGYDVNTRLLDGIARRGRGETGYVRPDEHISDVVGSFYASIGAPLLTQLELDFDGVRVDHMYPDPLPDLYRDREVTVFGRVHADRSAAVTVRGVAGGRTYVREHGVDFETIGNADTSFVANLWARRRVDALLTEIDEFGSTSRRVDEITSLGTRWGIVTPYTSYLAVDPREAVATGAPVREEMPERRRNEWTLDGDESAEPEATLGGGGRASVRTRGGETGAFGALGGARSADAPLPPSAAAAPRPDVGRDAVEGEIDRAQQLRATSVTESTPTRFASGRSFQSRGGAWVEDAAIGRAADRRIAYLSDDYFALLREAPELRDILALGSRIVFVHRGRVVEIIDAP